MDGPQDKYVQKAFAAVTMSAANTLTFSEINTGMAMFEKIAWVIHRIQYFPSMASIQELLANTDFLQMAVVGNSNMVSLSLRDQAVYDYHEMLAVVSGTPATGFILTRPVVKEFMGLPGGGLLVPPRPIYIAMDSGGFGAAGVCNARIEFTYKKLKADEYWELVEATRIIE